MNTIEAKKYAMSRASELFEDGVDYHTTINVILRELRSDHGFVTTLNGAPIAQVQPDNKGGTVYVIG